MDENTLRQTLRAHVTTNEPPLTITPADVLAAGHRARRWRVAGAVMGAGGLALIVTVLMPGLLPAGTPPVAAPGRNHLDAARYCAVKARSANLPPPLSTTDPTFGGPIPVPNEDARVLAARFSCYVMKAITALLPDAVFDNTTDSARNSVPLAFSPTAVVVTNDFTRQVSSRFNAAAIVSDAAGVGTIGFEVRSVSPAEITAVASCRDECQLRHGAHGELILVITPPADESDGATVVGVKVYSGQQVVTVSESNNDQRLPRGGTPGQTARPRPVTRPEPPLTVDQLIGLASSPHLDMFPR